MRNLIFILIVLFFASCKSLPVEISSLTAPSPSPSFNANAIIRDGKGNVIKPSGWQVPAFPLNRKYEPTVIKTAGREVTVLISWFMPKEKMIATIPKYWEDGEITYKVTQISAFKGKEQGPYCYNFTVTTDWPDPMNHPGVSTFFAYRDDDGDGVFETLGQGCAVPDWVN